MTISVKSDSLPPSIKECKVFILAHLTTDIPLPPGSLLTIGVFQITTIPFIDQLNQPIEMTMEHCSNDFSHLCFVVAKDCGQQTFKYDCGRREI